MAGDLRGWIVTKDDPDALLLEKPNGQRVRLWFDGKAEIERLRAESASKTDRIQELEDRISDRDVEIERLKRLVAAQDRLLGKHLVKGRNDV
jgi:hypothetical protein